MPDIFIWILFIYFWIQIGFNENLQITNEMNDFCKMILRATFDNSCFIQNLFVQIKDFGFALEDV